MFQRNKFRLGGENKQQPVSTLLERQSIELAVYYAIAMNAWPWISILLYANTVILITFVLYTCVHYHYQDSKHQVYAISLDKGD